MAAYALNLIDPNNWHKVPVTLPDGTQETARKYVSPEAESRHFAALQAAARDRLTDSNMQASIGVALEDPSRSSSEFAAAAVEWAQIATAMPKNDDADEDWMREQAVVTAAMIAMRDGDAELRAGHAEWARNVFAQTLQTKEDPVHRIRSGLRFNTTVYWLLTRIPWILLTRNQNQANQRSKRYAQFVFEDQPRAPSPQPWLREVVRTYGPWTAAANGAGLDAHEEVTDPPRELNNAYFDLLVHCLPGFASTEVDELALAPISSLPDEPFFDVMTQFLRSVDAVYFNNSILKEPIAINIRSALAHRLMASGGWKRLGRSRSASIEIHIGSAIATLFFNDHGYLQPAKCYLLPKGVDRLDPFLPVLENLLALRSFVPSFRSSDINRSSRSFPSQPFDYPCVLSKSDAITYHPVCVSCYSRKLHKVLVLNPQAIRSAPKSSTKDRIPRPAVPSEKGQGSPRARAQSL